MSAKSIFITLGSGLAYLAIVSYLSGVIKIMISVEHWSNFFNLRLSILLISLCSTV